MAESNRRVNDVARPDGARALDPFSWLDPANIMASAGPAGPAAPTASIPNIAAAAGACGWASLPLRAADDEADAAAALLAQDVLEECRTELMLAFRYLDSALWHMEFQPNEALFTVDTDGRVVAFPSRALIERYAHAPDELVRDYLHLVLHCIFRQPFDDKHPYHEAWSIACDVVVESIALEMAGARWVSPLDAERREEAERIEQLTGKLNQYKIYHAIVEAYGSDDAVAECGITQQDVARWRLLFFRDGHELWRSNVRMGLEADANAPERPAPPSEGERRKPPENEKPPKGDGDADDERPDEPDENARGDEAPHDSDDEAQSMGASSGASGSGSSSGASEGDDSADGQADGASMGSAGAQDRGVTDAPRSSGEEASDYDKDAEAWAEIGKQVEMALSSFSQKVGTAPGMFSINLALAARPPVDYAAFLRRFATPAEELKVNDDEFDYVFYAYGLRLYGNMPLVEPLEYQETNRVRTFVIALDTSGSTQGELVRMFATRTCEILRESEGFGSKVNVRIIECDASVQHETVITSREELDRYRDSFQVHGGGGTDFRPVFERVDDYLEEGELEDLQGLIYFTDGLGTFPERMPSYDTAFVFIDDEPRDRYVPPWAMKVVIDSECIREL